MSSTVIYHRNTNANTAVIEGATATILSPEDIASMAVLDIQPPLSVNERQLVESHDDLKLIWVPIPSIPGNANRDKAMRLAQQLNHPRLGSTDFDRACATCGHFGDRCTPHPACGTLPYPIQHVAFAKQVTKIANVVCFFCSGIIHTLLAEMSIVEDKYPGQCEQWSRFWLAAPEPEARKMRYITCAQCAMPNPTWRCNKDVVYASWPHEFYDTNYRPSVEVFDYAREQLLSIMNHYADSLSQFFDLQTTPLSRAIELVSIFLLQIPQAEWTSAARWLMQAILFLNDELRQLLLRQTITSGRLHGMFSNITHENVKRMGLDPLTNHPASLIWSILQVMPNILKPAVREMSGGQMKSTDAFTKQYTTIFGAVARCRYAKMDMMCAIKPLIKRLCVATTAEQDMENEEATMTTPHIEPVMPESVWTLVNLVDPWRFTDVRSLWLNPTPLMLTNIAHMQHEISALIDQRGGNNTGGGGNSGGSGGGANGGNNQKPQESSSRVGAKNVRRGAVSSNSAVDEDVMDYDEGADDQQPSQMAATNNTKGARTYTSLTPHVVDWQAKRDAHATQIGVSEWMNLTKQINVMGANPTMDVALEKNGNIDRAITPISSQETRGTEEDVSSSQQTTEVSGAAKEVHDASLESAIHLYRAMNDPRHEGTWMHPHLLYYTRVRLFGDDPTRIPRALALPEPDQAKYNLHKKSYTVTITGNQVTKQGSWRSARMKRSDHTERAILTPDGTLGIHELGLSQRSCLTQITPVTVNEHTRLVLQYAVAIGANHIQGAQSIVVHEDGQWRTIVLDEAVINPDTGNPVLSQPPEDIFLQDGWQVNLYIQDGTHVVINRQPTLHRPSHDSLRARRRNGRVVSLHENIMPGKGADCDGDAMCKCHPRSPEARAESCLLMAAPCNMVCPRTHRPITAMHQDSLLGTFLLSMEDLRLTQDEAQFIVHAIRHITPHRLSTQPGAKQYHGTSSLSYDGRRRHPIRDWPHLFSFASPERHIQGRQRSLDVSSLSNNIDDEEMETEKDDNVFVLPNPIGHTHCGKPLWSGRQILSLILPHDLTYYHTHGGIGAYDALSDETKCHDAKHRCVVIQQGQWLIGNGSQTMLGVAQNNLWHHIWRYYSKQLAADILSDWSHMAHAYLQLRGFTCGIPHIALGGEMTQDRQMVARLIYKHEHRLDKQHMADHVTDAQVNQWLMDTTQDWTSLQERFQLACWQEKEAAWQSVHAYYERMDEAVMEHANELTRQDVAALRLHAKQQVDRTVLDMASMMTTMTDESRNAVSLMKNSGAKGSSVNSNTMATCMPLERLGGTPAPYATPEQPVNARERTQCNEAIGHVSASTIGAITHGFLEGMTKTETIKHTMATWDKVYHAARPEKTGYQQRRVSGICENAVIYFDGTVRTSPSNVVQLAYGGDGYDALHVHQLRLTGSILQPDAARDLWRASHVSASSGTMPTSLGNVLLYAAKQTDKAAHNKNGDDTEEGWRHLARDLLIQWPTWFGCDGCEACLEAIHIHRVLADMLIDTHVNRLLTGFRTREHVTRFGITVHLNVHVSEIVRLHAAEWEAQFEHHIRHLVTQEAKCTLHQAKQFTEQQWLDLLSPHHLTNHAEWLDQVQTTTDAIVAFWDARTTPIDLMVHMRSVLHLQSKANPSLLMATKSQLAALLRDLYRTYAQNMADPGTAVGVMAAQSLGEPSTQATMKACKTEMGSSAQFGNQIKATADLLEALLSNRKPDPGDTCMTTLYLNPAWCPTMEVARNTVQRMCHQPLQYYALHSACFWMSLSVDETGIPIHSSLPLPPIGQLLPSNHPLAPHIALAIYASYDASSMQAPETTSFILAQMAAPPPIARQQGDSLPRDTWTQAEIEAMTPRWQSCLLKFQRGCFIGGPSAGIHNACPWYWLMWNVRDVKSEAMYATSANPGDVFDLRTDVREMTQLSSIIMTDWMVGGGIPGVLGVASLDAPSEPLTPAQMRLYDAGLLYPTPQQCFKVVFGNRQGCFEALMTHPAVMDVYGTTTNMRELETMFGEQCLPEHVQTGISSLLKGAENQYIQPRHIHLISNVLIADGYSVACNRAGLGQKSDTHWLNLAAFEDTPTVLLKSAFMGRHDTMSQMVSNILVGNRLKHIGTGSCGGVISPHYTHVKDKHARIRRGGYAENFIDSVISHQPRGAQ